MTLAEELLDSTVENYAGQDVDAEERDYDALKTAVADIYGVEVGELEPSTLEGLKPDEVSDALWPPILDQVREQGSAAPDRDPAARRARHHAADRRLAVEGPPLQPRPPQGRHRAARLRPEGSARRVQEGELRALHGDEGPDRGRDRPLPVAAHAGHRRGRRGAAAAGAAAGAAAAAADHAERTVDSAGAVAVRRDRRAARPPSAVAEPPRPARTGGDDAIRQVKRDEPKVGRNDPCPCGSGKKYKKCHGA